MSSWLSNMICSKREAAKLRSWVDANTVTPRALNWSRSVRVASWVVVSMPVNGSSSSRICGSWARARARNVRCCWPPESSPIGERASSVSPSCAIRFRDDLPVACGGPAHPPKASVASHHHDVLHGDRKPPIDLAALWDVSDAILVRAQGPSMDEDRAASQRQQPDKRLEKGGLASTIWPDDRGPGAMGNKKRNPAHDGLAVVTDGHIR